MKETDPAAGSKLLNDLKQVKDKVLQLLMNKQTHFGVKLRAIKFLEMLVLAFSTPDVSLLHPYARNCVKIN